MLAAQQSTFAGRFAVRAAARQTGRRTAVVVRAEETKVTKARARSCHARPARGWGCTGAVQRGGPISIGLYSGLVAACTAGPWPRHAPAACSQRLDGSPRSAAGPGVLLQADSSNLFARARLRLARPPRAGICRFKRGGRRRDSAVAASAHRRITTPPRRAVRPQDGGPGHRWLRWHWLQPAGADLPGWHSAGRVRTHISAIPGAYCCAHAWSPPTRALSRCTAAAASDSTRWAFWTRRAPVALLPRAGCRRLRRASSPPLQKYLLRRASC